MYKLQLADLAHNLSLWMGC